MSAMRKRTNLASEYKETSKLFEDSDAIPEAQVPDTVLPYPRWFSLVSSGVGVMAMIYCTCYHCWLIYTLHENNMWFTNIKEVEREISFRTESGLYYSYYKQLVSAPSLLEGIGQLVEDKLTEFPDTINVLARMNVYQEMVLATIYRAMPSVLKEDAIFFYIKVVFGLNGGLVASLFFIAWLLSGTWLSGILAAAFYITNRADVTRVAYAIPLRESFSLPFLWLQAAGMTVYLSPGTSTFKKVHSAASMGVLSTMMLILSLVKRTSLLVVSMATFLFSLTWQFSQFILLLQACSLMAVWATGVVPTCKVLTMFAIQVCSLAMVCILQFFNKMIVGSLALSFIFAASVAIYGSRLSSPVTGIIRNARNVVLLSLCTIVLMFVINMAIKVVVSVDADEHIFKFLYNKLIGTDTRLHVVRTAVLVMVAPCITHSVSVSYTLEADACRNVALLLVLAFLLTTHLSLLNRELEELQEFWDPDTVELMEWIQADTAPMASFSGSMQLMAGVKLCTGRPINNHPHYEDKHLRLKTKELYQVYSRHTAAHVHALLKSLSSDFVILEDSICLRAPFHNCRLTDIVDLDNGIVPEDSDPIPGLNVTTSPRFCEEVRYQGGMYGKLFKQVFVNKTFHVYKIT